MNFEEYQVLARRTQSEEMTDNDKLYHALFGMCSEVGEIHSVLQHFYQGQRDEEGWKAKIAEEAGDLLWFHGELCDALHISMGDVARNNIRKLIDRYPDGFDPDRSAHRHEIKKER